MYDYLNNSSVLFFFKGFVCEQYGVTPPLFAFCALSKVCLNAYYYEFVEYICPLKHEISSLSVTEQY